MNRKKSGSDSSIQWFQALLYLGLVDLISTIMGFVLSVPSDITGYIIIGLRASMTICYFQLIPIHHRYKKAAIFQAVVFLGTFIEAFASEVSVVDWVTIVFLLLGRYQEYTGHSEVIAGKNAKLSKKWNSLFKWELVAGVLLSVLTFLVSTALVVMNIDHTLKIVVSIMSVPMCVFDVLYLVYMNRMLTCLDESEVR